MKNILTTLISEFFQPYRDPLLEQDLFAEVLKRRKTSAWGSLFLASVIFLTDLKFSLSHFIKPYGFAFSLLFLANIIRVLLDFKFEHKKLYYTITSISLGSWPLLASCVLVRKGTADLQSVVSLLILAGAASGSVSILAAAPSLALGAIFSIVLIPASALLFIENGALIALICFAYSIYLVSHALQLFRLIKSHLQQKYVLQSEQKLIHDALDSIPGFFSILTRDLKYILVNKYILELFKLEQKDFENKPLGFIGVSDSFSNTVKNFHQSKNNFSSTRIQISVNNKDQWHSLNLTRLPESGEIMILALNIQNQVDLEAQNLDQKIKLEQSQRMAELGLISGGISHEINNPLAIIIGKLSLLRKKLKQDPPPGLDLIAADITKLEETTHRIVRIVRSIMSFAHPNNSEAHVNILASTLMEDVKDFTFERLNSSNTKLTIDITEGLEFVCQPTQLIQVLVNLISNARDASKNSDNPEIKISLQSKNEFIEITVEDNGPGVDPEHLEKILLPFFTTKEPGKGTGLGLSISNTIVKSHQGTLTVEKSKALGGALFRIVLPLRPKSVTIDL